MATGQIGTLIQCLRRLTRPRPEGGLTDAQLLARYVNDRDEAAFEVLVWRHSVAVLGVCRRVLRHEQDAEDVFQAAFLTLARRAHTITEPGAVGPWLYRVAYHAALRAREGAARKTAAEEHAAQSPAREPVEELSWRDLRPVLDAEVNGLPEKYRVPFVLSYLEGRTHEEIARDLDCPLGTVASRLAWARSGYGSASAGGA
jgi:RNA polymerase sigma factor (sigma-70 family)